MCHCKSDNFRTLKAFSQWVKTTNFFTISNKSNDGKLSFSPSSAKESMVSLLLLINEAHQECFDF